MLADSLKASGISSYRYDKRSVGKSTIVKESDVDFYDFINDASAIVNYFSKDFKHINIIGHSEGALIGTLVSLQNPSVQSFVNLSGMSISLDSIILEQVSGNPIVQTQVRKHFNEIKSTGDLSDVDPGLAALFRPSIVNYLKTIIVYDPSVEHSKIVIPVFVIGGTCDIQVPKKHAIKLYAALKDNALHKYAMIEGMGHLLKRNQADCSDSQSSYTDGEKPLHPQLSPSITEFINSASTPKSQDP